MRAGLLSAMLGLLAVPAPAAAAEIHSGGPYVPTPQRVVEAMLQLAQVKAGDMVIDLGSGDGRIVITAAQKYGARGKGYDIDAELVGRSNASARRLQLEQRAHFEQRDVLQADIGEASVVTLYLLPEMMRDLRAKLLRDLKPGTRIVSHDFDFGDWAPERKVVIDLDEKYDISGSWTSTLYLWTVPERPAR